MIDDDVHVGGASEHRFDGGVAIGRSADGEGVFHLAPVLATGAVKEHAGGVVATLLGHAADEGGASVFLGARLPHLQIARRKWARYKN